MPSTLRLHHIHLKLSYMRRTPPSENDFNRLAMMYDPMPVGAIGQPCEPRGRGQRHGLTFTLVYADDLESQPKSAVFHAHPTHRRMH